MWKPSMAWWWSWSYLFSLDELKIIHSLLAVFRMQSLCFSSPSSRCSKATPWTFHGRQRKNSKARLVGDGAHKEHKETSCMHHLNVRLHFLSLSLALVLPLSTLRSFSISYCQCDFPIPAFFSILSIVGICASWLKDRENFHFVFAAILKWHVRRKTNRQTWKERISSSISTRCIQLWMVRFFRVSTLWAACSNP